MRIYGNLEFLFSPAEIPHGERFHDKPSQLCSPQEEEKYKVILSFASLLTLRIIWINIGKCFVRRAILVAIRKHLRLRFCFYVDERKTARTMRGQIRSIKFICVICVWQC